MDITKETPPIDEFLQIYPKVSLKIEPNENDNLVKHFNISNKFKKKKGSIILDMNQIRKLMKLQNKSKISSLNFENRAVLSVRKINKSNDTNKVLYKILQEEEDVEKYVDRLNEDLFLINKGIEEQKRNIKRTKDVKRALESFLEKSELIQNLSKNYGINNNINSLEDSIINEKIKDRIKILISNLADNVLFEKYEKGKFIIKKNDIGKNCYFLLSGRLSILKPVEYKGIKISYENYMKYLLNLLDKKEKIIFDKVTKLNWLFIKIYNEENLKEIIKYYIQKRISVYSNVSYDLSIKDIKEDLTLKKVESFLFEYKLKFEDFGISKENLFSDLKKIINENLNDFQFLINNYLKGIFKINKGTQMILNSYDFLFENYKNRKDNLVTLYKYETFLLLSPGAFFGEMSLNIDNSKRNVCIRTETDSIVASLSTEKYFNLLMDEDKKIIMRQINFICNNFFFNKISQKIFSKYYFSMFKLINKSKNDIIYEQGSDSDSIFFIRDGTIKYEINASIIEIHNLIYFLISRLKRSETFKLNSQLFDELKSIYLKNHYSINLRNASIILIEKIDKVQNFELNTSESFEVLGLPEFFFELPCITTCSVVSKNARIFGLSRYNLNNIASYEKQIKEDLNKLIFEKIVTIIRRLFNIENNFITMINSRINSNFYKIYDTKFYNNIKFERNNNLLEKNKAYSTDNKEEEKNKKYINEKEYLIMKNFSKMEYENDNIIKNSSPIKFNKKIINQKLMSEIKNLNSSHSYQKLNLKTTNKDNVPISKNSMTQSSKNAVNNNNLSNEEKIKNFKLLIKEKSFEEKGKKIDPKEIKNIIIKRNISNEKNNNSNNSNFYSNIINLKDSINNSSNQTLINIGKSYISLPKLRKLIISTGKARHKNLSIVQNKFNNVSQISDLKEDISLNEDENQFNENNNKIDRSFLPKIIRQNSCHSLPINIRIKRKINKIVERRGNHSEMNTYQYKEDDKNILAKYIKRFYQKQKVKGYSAILNPKFNTIIKKKENKTPLNLQKK